MAGAPRAGRRSSSFRFAAASVSARAARDWARPLIQSWGMDGSTPDALLVLTELVANAVRHGSGPVDVTLAVREDAAQSVWLRIEVSDSDTGPLSPPQEPPSDAPTSGRGLHIVTQLSRTWGIEYAAGHKTVWAELPA